MDTPICDFVRDYRDGHPLRLHMPGHKGQAVLGAEPLDITEIDGADVLYHADGIIRRSEDNAAVLFGAARTVYSAEGSSLCIRAMLYLVQAHARAAGRRAVIAAGRNAHKTFVTAAALLDVDIAWLFSEKPGGVISCALDVPALEQALTALPESPVAVYITTPDYLGNQVDVGALAAVCHRHDTLLLVDNAHGAYLRFLPVSRHPMDLGADMCCDSAHKTLPVLTGGAYLHISHNAPPMLLREAERAMALFASTSPSYLILQSLDAANRYLAEGYPDRLAAFAGEVAALKERLARGGYLLVGDEPMKLTVAPKSVGYTGGALANILREAHIECEFADPDFLTMMFTPESGRDALDRVEAVLSRLPRREAIAATPPVLSRPQRMMSAREALFAPHRLMAAEACAGRVMGDAAVSCPPAVPIVVSGERIDESAVRCLTYYGIDTCCVVDE